MRPRFLSVMTAVLLAVLALAVVHTMSVLASPTQGPPDPSDEPAIREQFFSFPGVREKITEANSADDLTLGAYTQIHYLSEEFLSGTVTQGLAAQVIPYDQWVLPASFQGEVIGAAFLTTPFTDTWDVQFVEPSAFAQALSDLQPSDRLLFVDPAGFYWIVRGENLIEFFGVPDRYAETTTLRQYQLNLMDTATEMAPYPTPFWGGAGGAPPAGSAAPKPDPGPPVLLLGLGALAVIGLGITIRRR